MQAPVTSSALLTLPLWLGLLEEQTFDTDQSGTIELSEFIRWCLNIDTMAWKAERVRRTTVRSPVRWLPYRC